MTYATDTAKMLSREISRLDDPDDGVEKIQAVLDEVRGLALKEAAAWHQRRQQLHLAAPKHASAVALEERRVRAHEAETAANYFIKLPDAEAAKNLPCEVGSDAQTAAFRILYERSPGETNAFFLERAAALIDEALLAAAARAAALVPVLEANLPTGWRLEKIEIFGDKATKYKATLVKLGGLFANGFGATTRAAMVDVINNIPLAEALNDAASDGPEK